MPSKKKKFNSRFPPARIKKIMQTDEEVGKVAAAVPVIISRALEMFIETLIVKTGETTHAKNAKTLTATHIKQTIQSEKKFDFLRDLVSSVPDHQAEDEGECSTQGETKKIRRPRKQKDKPQKRGRKKKSSDSSEENSHTSNNGDNPMCDDTVEDEEEDDEDTETDEDDHSSEYHPGENASHDQSFNASSPNSSGLAQKSNLTSPISHASSSFVSPYGQNHMPPPGQMLPHGSTGLNNMPPPTSHLMSQGNPVHNMLPPGSYGPPGNTGHNNMPLPPGNMMLHGNMGHNNMPLPGANMMPQSNAGHTGMPLPGQIMSPGSKFVPLMPPFPCSGFPPPITINDQNQPLDLCTGSSSKNNNSVGSQNSEDDDYDT